MASLRLPCCLSSKTPSFSINPITPKFTSLHNQPNNFTFNTNTNNISLSHSLCFPIRNNNKFRHFLLHFSSTTQDHPVVDSSSLDDVVTEYQSKAEEKEEELSKTRLLASNVPWNCTAEDIRALFQKFGTVVDVELSMYSKTRNRGLAFVTMGSPEEAVAALNNLESYEFEGRTLKMNYAKAKKKKPSPPPPPKPGPTFNLFVANLPFESKSKDLKEFFIAEGANVVSAEIIFHDNPRRPSGYGFVAFKTKKEADYAISTFSEKEFMGRQLRVARSRQFVKQRKEDASQSDGTSGELESEKVQADTANDN
uniref:RRM domain-containing protein n=1 Tax=Populus davidiana TaxID=266767 RepID=A0A6M2ER84_9ROSI